jgi:hypothetical protein
VAAPAAHLQAPRVRERQPPAVGVAPLRGMREVVVQEPGRRRGRGTDHAPGWHYTSMSAEQVESLKTRRFDEDDDDAPEEMAV